MRRLIHLSLLGLLATAQFPGSVAAQVASSAQSSPARHPWAGHVADAAQRFGIPERWIWVVMRVESNGDVRAVSSAGAMGLMQIMPGTWAELRRRYRLGADPFDPRDNIMAGAAYLREMFDRYGDPVGMLAAYNAGPGRYDAHLATGARLPRETRAYVAILAPAIGGGAPRQAVTPDPHGWRNAPLFAALSGDLAASDGADNAAAERDAVDSAVEPDPPARPSVAPVAVPAEPVPDRLFVPRAQPKSS